MNRPTFIPQPPWTDDQLASAIRASTNWRSVMLLLGFGERSKSASAVRIVRRRAAELDLDWSHFRGKRRWSDEQLRQAVGECHSWTELLSRLGLSANSGNVAPHIKSHAVRLGLDTSHLSRLSHTGRQPSEESAQESDLKAQRRYLRVAAGASPPRGLPCAAAPFPSRLSQRSTTCWQAHQRGFARSRSRARHLRIRMAGWRLSGIIPILTPRRGSCSPTTPTGLTFSSSSTGT